MVAHYEIWFPKNTPITFSEENDLNCTHTHTPHTPLPPDTHTPHTQNTIFHLSNCILPEERGQEAADPFLLPLKLSFKTKRCEESIFRNWVFTLIESIRLHILCIVHCVVTNYIFLVIGFYQKKIRGDYPLEMVFHHNICK